MSLKFNVAGLLKEPVGATRNHDIHAPFRPAATDRPAQIDGDATFLHTPRGVLVTAKLRGTLAESCSRCLTSVEQPVLMMIEEEFIQTIDIETGARIEGADPDDFRVDTSHTLDLEDAIRQYWSAALPMQVLCRPDCRGLCSGCGANLNQADHQCASETDERWSALRALAGNVEGS